MRRLRSTTWALAAWSVLCGVVALLWIWFGMLVLFLVWLVTRAPRPITVPPAVTPSLAAPRVCTTCGSAVTISAAYCHACGDRVAPAAQPGSRHAVMVGS